MANDDAQGPKKRDAAFSPDAALILHYDFVAEIAGLQYILER